MFHFLGIRIELLSVLPHGEDCGIALTLSQGASIPAAFFFFFVKYYKLADGGAKAILY